MGLFLACFFNPVVRAEVCEHARSSAWSDGQAIAYLKSNRDVQTPACTSLALQRLAEPDASPDPALLAEYIDFLRPGVSGMIVLRVGNAADLYPAVKALIGIGAEAVPTLAALLKRPGVGRSVRRNATRTVKLIYEARPEHGIDEILRAAAGESGIARKLLEEAATWLYAWCTDAKRERCSTVYNVHRGQ